MNRNFEEPTMVVTTDSKISTPIFNPTVPTNEKETFTKILAFEKELAALSSGQESIQTGEMPTNDVVWNIEALLNARYADADKPFKSTSIEKTVIRIPRNANNAVDKSNLPTAVENARQKIASHWNTISTENKHIVLVDISIVEVESVDLLLSITNVMGFDTPEAEPFTEAWRWGLKEGKCTDRTLRIAADEKLTEAINLRYPKAGAGWLGFFTDIETFQEFPGSHSNPAKAFQPQNNMRDFLFFEISSQFSPTPAAFEIAKCISVADMNWYYNNYFNFISSEKQRRGKDFSTIEIQGDAHLHLEPTTGDLHNVFSHISRFTFGTFHRSSCREICGNPNFPCYIVCLCTPNNC